MSLDRTVLLTVLAMVALATVGCQPAGEPVQHEQAAPAAPQRDVAQDRLDVIRAHEARVGAYRDGDVDAFVRVLDPKAELLIFVTPRILEEGASIY